MLLDTKRCNKCKQVKAFGDFTKELRGRYGLKSYCKTCMAAANRAWCRANPERARAFLVAWRTANPAQASKLARRYALKLYYGLTLEAYDQMLADQGGRCANPGCGAVAPKRGAGMAFAVDHDHVCCPGRGSCGKCIRGLLCRPCNTAIGMLRDDPAVVLGALQYLRDHSRKAAQRLVTARVEPDILSASL